MGMTDWLKTVILDNWPWLLVIWVCLSGLGWWAQAVAMTNLAHRLDRFERDEYLAVKNEAEARERNASMSRLLTDVGQTLAQTNRVLGEFTEKDAYGGSRRRLRVDTDS